MCEDDTVARYDDVSNDSLSLSSSDGTIVPGTQFEGTVVPAMQIEEAEDAMGVTRITPYNALTNRHHCEAVGRTVGDRPRRQLQRRTPEWGKNLDGHPKSSQQ